MKLGEMIQKNMFLYLISPILIMVLIFTLFALQPNRTSKDSQMQVNDYSLVYSRTLFYQAFLNPLNTAEYVENYLVGCAIVNQHYIKCFSLLPYFLDGKGAIYSEQYLSGGINLYADFDPLHKVNQFSEIIFKSDSPLPSRKEFLDFYRLKMP
jgi:hypothetical protein